jgi:hypothetical protein
MPGVAPQTQMTIKLALLKSGETLMADAKEIYNEINQPVEYIFIKPHKIETRKSFLLTEDYENHSGDLEVSLSPWIVLTSDDQILVPLDWVVTIVEPIETIKQMYEEKINGETNQVSFT